MNDNTSETVEDYDIFISYDELTADSYAERIYDILTRNLPSSLFFRAWWIVIKNATHTGSEGIRTLDLRSVSASS